MGATNRDHKQPVKGPESVIPYFQGFGDGTPLMGGAELEIFLMRRADQGFKRVSDYENFKLFESLRSRGQSGTEHPTPVSQEPEASQIETQSRPHILEDIHFVSQEIAAHRATILRHAAALTVDAAEIENLAQQLHAQKSLLRPPALPLLRGDLVASPFAVLPYGPGREALSNVISPRGHGQDYSDRPRIMSKAFNLAMGQEAQKYPVSNTAVHFTHGVRDLRHGFEMSRLQAALLPFFFVQTENRPPYGGDNDNRIRHHTGLRAHMALNMSHGATRQQRGLLPDFLFAARDEHDFIARMVDTTLNTPMLAYYDHAGDFRPAPAHERITPAAMRGHGPEDLAQFELALSTFWWSFKYKLPPNGGLFHELRDFDSGPEVVTNITLIAGMLALNDAARADMINRLERKYDIPVMSDPETAQKIIRKNLYGAYHRGDTRVHSDSDGRHMLVPFGATGRTMLDFLRSDLLPMLERQYRGTPAEQQLGNLRFVAQNGMTNAQLWHDAFDSAATQRAGIRAMTADLPAYNRLYAQNKSWAQHHDEGKLPALRLRPRP